MQKLILFFVLLLTLDGCAAIPGYFSCIGACNDWYIRNEKKHAELDKRLLEQETLLQVAAKQRQSQAAIARMEADNQYLRMKQAKQLETDKLKATIEGESGLEVQQIQNEMQRKQNMLDLETNRLRSELNGKTEAVEAENKGRAEYVRAQQNRRIKVLEREADLEGATLSAKSEVERAKGVAAANKIIGESLKSNEAYLRWLWIEHVSSGEKPSIIYVPTEAGMPILEAGKRP